LPLKDYKVGRRLAEGSDELEKPERKTGLAINGNLPMREARPLAISRNFPAAAINHAQIQMAGHRGQVIHEKNRSASGPVFAKDMTDFGQVHLDKGSFLGSLPRENLSGIHVGIRAVWFQVNGTGISISSIQKNGSNGPMFRRRCLSHCKG
jgi:hypothetical protein